MEGALTLVRELGQPYGECFAYELELAASEILTNIVQHAYGGKPGEIRLPWRVLAPHAQGGRAQDPVSALVLVHGIDPASEAARQLKRRLFAPPKAQQIGHASPRGFSGGPQGRR